MSTFTNKSLSHKTRRKIGKSRSRWRDVRAFLLFLLVLVSLLAVSALLLCGVGAFLLYGVCLIVMMCWRGSALGFVLLSALVLLVVGFFVVRRNLREREFRSLLSRGVDFGLKDESLQSVDEIIREFGRPCRRVSTLRAEVAPMVETLARRYNSIRIGKKNAFNCHDLRAGLAIGYKGCPDDWFYGIAYEDESCYLVKRSPSDETIYYIEYEWMRSPIPYASDINHYIALRHQECKERDLAKGNSGKDVTK